MKWHVYADPLRLSVSFRWTKMSPPFGLLSRLSLLSKNTSYLRSSFAVSQARCFSTTQTVFVRKNKDRPAPTKAKLAARERKKALKARKNAYEHEKMPLSEAISVLRVCILVLLVPVTDLTRFLRLWKSLGQIQRSSWLSRQL